MKKIFLMLMVVCCVFVTGCFGKDNNSALKDIRKKYENLKAYQLTGNLEILNNNDVYNYDVKVIYQKKDKFYVSLKNLNNNHEQIILKNEDGVYVLTPSLNKSFKFQSDWPYNNSQVYLIQSILDDILDDEERNLVSDDNGYIFTTSVNYPNNRKLVKQIVTFDKKLNLKKVSVVDENNISQMTMTFATIDLSPTVNSDTFDLNKIMGTTENGTGNSSNNTTENNTDNNIKDNNQTSTDNKENNSNQTTSTLEDVIYPLYIPTGTSLTSQEKINNYELSSNAYMQQGTMVGAYAQSMKDAANNANGATTGFMGIGMANMASGGVMGGATTAPWQNTSNSSVNNNSSTSDMWECPNCKKQVKGNFCPDCGQKKPEKVFCSNCGKKVENGAKFCPNCGNKLN